MIVGKNYLYWRGQFIKIIYRIWYNVITGSTGPQISKCFRFRMNGVMKPFFLYVKDHT